MLIFSISYFVVELINLAIAKNYEPLLITFCVYISSDNGRAIMSHSNEYTFTSGPLPKSVYILLGMIIWIDSLILTCMAVYSKAIMKVNLAILLNKTAKIGTVLYIFIVIAMYPLDILYMNNLKAINN